MKQNKLFSQIIRLACVGLVLVFIVAQPLGASRTQANSNLRTVNNEEPPIDMSKVNAEPVEQNPIVDTVDYSGLQPATGTEEIVDYTLPAGYVSAPIAPEESVGPIYQGPPSGSEGGMDNTQPNSSEIPVGTPDQAPNPLEDILPGLIPNTANEPQAPSDQDRTIQPGTSSEGVEWVPALYGNLDDFDRLNGSIGTSWNMVAGSISIVDKVAQSPLTNVENLAIYPGIGENSLEADIAIQPGGGTQYSALVLNYGAGVSNIFIKVQDNNGDGLFDSAACYKGNNGSAFGLGFFGLPSTFSNTHLQIRVDSTRNVFLYFTKINGGTGALTYICSGAPAFEGNALGMGSYGGGRIDNLSVPPAIPILQEKFDRQEGPLGSNWSMHAGSISIRNHSASSSTALYNGATYNGLASNSVEADVSLSLPASTQYSGFVLNYGQGVNNLFVKVQDNAGTGSFNTAACYLGNGGSFGLGFFTLSSPFTKAHMQVAVNDARTVFITFTKINGGTGSQTYTCAGAPLPEGYGVGIASYGGGVIDNFQSINDFSDSFSRANGALGTDWVNIATGFSITNGAAQGLNQSLALYNGRGSSTIEGDISLSSPPGVQYSGFVLNYGAGVNDIFVKVQDNNGDGTFDSAGCYTGNNNSSAPFGLGFFTMAAPFASAHAAVTVTPDRYVTLSLTKINGGSGVQVYTCASAPSAEGGAVGIASYYGGRIDNVVVNRVYAFDGFNRSNGAVGPSWSGRSTNFEIIGMYAFGGTIPSLGLTIFNNSVGNSVEGDIYNSATGVQYAGFVLNYGQGVNNIFVKVQDNNGDGTFDSAACYKGNNGTAFGPGFFALSSPFSYGHAQVTVDASRTVTLILTRINGGTGVQTYTCSGAPPAEGKAVGMVGYNYGVVDNFTINDHNFTQPLYIPVILK